jgi:micrococcal nuclease
MGLGQWIIIIVLVAIIIFGFAAVFDFSKGVIRNVYPQITNDTEDPLIMSKVVRVIDGDTIVLESGEHVRFAIVNTPEKGQEGWQEAKDWTSYKCLDKDVMIDMDNGQPLTYGRPVAAVYCDSGTKDGSYEFINYELIDLGFGVVMTNYCKVSEFAKELCP